MYIFAKQCKKVDKNWRIFFYCLIFLIIDTIAFSRKISDSCEIFATDKTNHI